MSEKLARLEGVTDPLDLILLKTAALWHDVGFMEQYKANEPIGCRMAQEDLPQFGYTKEHIERVKELIMATVVPQQPKNHLAQILCDADLSNLGLDNYFLLTEALRMELATQNIHQSPRKWHENNINFLKKHSYHTKSAKELLQPVKDKNIAQTYELLGMKPE
eukprot:TRINITY_DN42630_c0_g1_i1.p2 TRINITY_DN42630_c0_g1~~TRINITY_DN42630_c0_g1_i1.p2  ORF type:complete len:163 (+),score=33.07 TRINITY_DN42630_c0_g1_i1:3-491(+)